MPVAYPASGALKKSGIALGDLLVAALAAAAGD
jgi:hypothetical protein